MVAGCSGEDASRKLTGQLTYVRDGGFAGAHDELMIHPDGRAGLAVRGQAQRDFKLSETDFDKVAGALDGVEVERLPPELESDQPVFDAFTHTVTYEGHRVTTDDVSIPPSLRPC
jgi:hypothetical protein